MTTRKQVKAAADEQPRRKQLRLRPELLADAKKYLGTRTDSETIERALEEVIALDSARRRRRRRTRTEP